MEPSTRFLCQLNLKVAELVKSFEHHREFPKVLTTSATEETLIFNRNPQVVVGGWIGLLTSFFYFEPEVVKSQAIELSVRGWNFKA